MEKSKRILVIRLSALGDVAMTVPVIYSLASQYPALKIDVLTRPFFAQLFINHPSNITIIEADMKGRHKGVGGMLRLLKELNACRSDYVADLHNVLRSWLIDTFFQLKGKQVVMVDKQRDGRKKVLYRKGWQSGFINRYADVFAELGYPVELRFSSVFNEGRPQLPISIQHPAIGIAPFARYINKIYPLPKMRQVVERLTEEGFHVYLFGSRGKEEEQLNLWQQDNANCTSLAGRYTLADELAFMSYMDVMITMDSANQHMAAMVGTKVLSIWGSTTPSCGFLSYSQDASHVICLNLPCQPCSIAGGNTCPMHHFHCLNLIEPETIVQKVKSLI